MINALRQKELVAFLEKSPAVTTQELLQFYRQFTPALPIATLRWRIYELKQQGIIYSPRKGLYVLSRKKSFQPSPNQKMATLAHLLQKKFPSVRFSIYPTQWIGNLSTHMYQSNNLIVEIDADVLNAAFHFLKDQFPNTFVSPDQKMYDYYILPQEENIIVNRLYVDAPLSKAEENYYTPKLEKLIIDILMNSPIIFPVGAAEIEAIISTALETYNINVSTLTRYATKRNAKHKLDKLLSFGEGEV